MNTVDPSVTARCPACREAVSEEARVCSRCQAPLLYDVTTRPVGDPRVRYRVARALAGSGITTPMTTLQQALASGGVLVRSVTLTAARAAAEHARANGVEVSVAESTGSSATRSSPGGRPRWVRAAAIVGISTLVVAALAAGRLRSSRSGASGTQRDARSSAVVVNAAPLPGPELARRGLAGTVSIRCRETIGSGFFVTMDTVLTNAHVLCAGDEAPKVRLENGQELSGATIGSDELLDLAVLKVEGAKATPLPLGDAGSLAVGDDIVMVGSPVGMEFTVHRGNVSNLSRTHVGLAYIQIDAKVNPGNSGGPLLDQAGRVVGVVSLKRSDAEGIGLALPINYAYGGTAALVKGPEATSAAFAKMRGAAEAENRRAVGDLQTSGQRPGLVGIVVQGGELKAQILWPSIVSPVPQTFTFVLWDRTDRLCTGTAPVSSWQKVESRDGGSVLKPQVKAWLERNGFSSDLYAGLAGIHLDSCSPEQLARAREIEMEGADSDASRLRL
jgi:S1-C subfamily serine protease